jgi:hypothetical protein
MSGELIDEDIKTSDSAGVTTTETVVHTLVAPVVAGRRYQLSWFGDLASSVAGDQFFVKIREDSVSGNTLDFRRYRANAAVNFPYYTETRYTADATEDKTWVLTLIRESGTGTGRLDAAATSPAFFRCNYLDG